MKLKKIGAVLAGSIRHNPFFYLLYDCGETKYVEKNQPCRISL